MSMTATELVDALEAARDIARRSESDDPWVRGESVKLIAKALISEHEDAKALEKKNDKLVGDMQAIHDYSAARADANSAFVHIRRIAASNLT